MHCSIKFTRMIRLKKCSLTVLTLCIFLFVSLSSYSSHKEMSADVTTTFVLITPSLNTSSLLMKRQTATNDSSKDEYPYLYSDRVELRIIVMTCNRPSSLLKLLQSLEVLALDGHTAAVEIWIDRKRKTGEVDERTVNVASEFRWSGGPTRVHVHTAHVGIYGQWIDTWRPRDDYDDELALFLEDDLSVSKYAYRWMRAVFHAYSHRRDFAGVSLVGYQMRTLVAKPKHLAGPKQHPVVMYRSFSAWGFAPKPYHWRHFQNWYHTHKPSVAPSFHPYVPGTIITSWYRSFEVSGTASSMWSIWFVYYMRKNQLYAVFSNLDTYNSDNRSSFVVNRNEAGLHFANKKSADVSRLLTVWKDEYAKFPVNIRRLNWDGSYIPDDARY